MASRSRDRTESEAFLGNYKSEETYLLKADPAKGRPGMLEAVSPNGDPVIIRVWPRRTRDDEDLVDIWRHELRQLHRLGGYPGAQRYIARLVDAGSDRRGFYIVLDSGQRRPLNVVLKRGRGATEWLRALNLAANRHRLWANLLHVARGLEILHNEGLVHRNLDDWAVLTSAGDEPDFQLTGFEWSLRLSSTADVPGHETRPGLSDASFGADWAAYAKLAALVLNVNLDRLADPRLPDYEVHDSAGAEEIRLLRDLSRSSALSHIDGELVSRRIEGLLGTLDAQRSSTEGRYHLVLRFGRQSPLSQSIRDASGLLVEMDEPGAQAEWIAADLGNPVALITSREREGVQLYARGRELVYRLKQYRNGPADAPSWQAAFCETAEIAGEWRRTVLDREDLPFAAMKLVPSHEARGVYQRIRGRAPSWGGLLARIDGSTRPGTSKELELHRAVTLLHAVEVAFAAAGAFPVSVAPGEVGSDLVRLEYRPTTDAEDLSQALGIDPPLKRLVRSLEGGDADEGEGWSFTETARLGQAHAGDVELAFEGRAPGMGNGFLFRPTGQLPVVAREGFLVPEGARGDFVQFRRRSAAIRKLKDHVELLLCLADPRGRLIPTHERVIEDDGYAELDDAKQKALQEITAVLPMYLLQGPPGVGKTYLIRDLVRRRLADERSTRILVTAQGNHAIDHLLDELAGMWRSSDSEPPLAVRCRAPDASGGSAVFDLSRETARLAAAAANSRLAAVASPSVASRLDAMARSGAADRAGVGSEFRSLEGLVMRAANLVFATTNSGDLERLLEERGQFDWTIVEEAGKATGCELVTPLMLSHRRLLIGDHQQLPPFGAAELEAFLGDPQRVRAALRTVPRIIDRAVRNLLDEELLEFLDDESQDVERLCTDAKRALYLFESALVTELDRQQVRPGGRPIAGRLVVQHRMHPSICELLTRTFYPDLRTSTERTGSAAAHEDWIASSNHNVLPPTPIVFIDMPYERSSPGIGRIESSPHVTNQHEVAEAVRAIAALEVKATGGKKPSLVILAPYKRQVRRLKEAVLGDSAAARALDGFRPVARGGEWCSTVDAFQGNEADVVIFSLTRNNRGATLRRALGFVGDRRRFNVLLSRARERLVFIGSLEFLRTVSEPLGLEADHASEFLRKFVRAADELVVDGTASRVQGTGLLGANAP